jgi:hypothetical protein
MYTPDLKGTLYLLRQGQPQPYLDVRGTFTPNFFSGRGLGSGFGFVAFHPDFARNGKFYTTHSEAFDALTTKTPDFTQAGAVIQSVVSEWTATDPTANTFAGTRREMLRLGFGSFIHAIQQISFNPNAKPGDADYGMLYLAVGEGGLGVRGTDPQNLAVPFGKIVRIDPMGTNSANGKYGVPASNPFVGTPGALGEIWAYGMRDPHRFSWDTGGAHRMFLGHIGEKDVESVVDVRPATTSLERREALRVQALIRPTCSRCPPTTRSSATSIRCASSTTTRRQGCPATRTSGTRSAAASCTAAPRRRSWSASTSSAISSTAASSTRTRATCSAAGRAR